jgi:hypothetical protein
VNLKSQKYEVFMQRQSAAFETANAVPFYAIQQAHPIEKGVARVSLTF